MEVQSETILTGYSEREKGAYFAALASLATADRQASQEELEHLKELARAAGLSPEQEQFILHAANDLSGEDLKESLEVLKSSDLRYSLITDLIALAKADENYTEDEKLNIDKIATHLDVNNKQVSLLDQFVDRAAETETTPEQATQPGFLDSLGLRDRFSKAGFDMGSIGRNVMGMLGPLVLGSLAARALGRRRAPMGGMGGGPFGGGLGGMFGGGGGLGTLINGINRSRNNRTMGGLLRRMI